MQVKQIIIKYFEDKLKQNDVFFFPSYYIETELPSYAKTNYSILRTPATYARVYREMREEKLFDKYGIILREVEGGDKSYKHFTAERKQDALH